MLLSLLPLASPCGEDTATGGTTQCYKAKLKGMCAEKNSWVRSRCSATCCGIAVDANAVAEAKASRRKPGAAVQAAGTGAFEMLSKAISVPPGCDLSRCSVTVELLSQGIVYIDEVRLEWSS